MKNKTEVRRELDRGVDREEMEMEWDSKVDYFDKRLRLLRRMQRGSRSIEEGEVRNVSLFEFYWQVLVSPHELRACPPAHVFTQIIYFVP